MSQRANQADHQIGHFGPVTPSTACCAILCVLLISANGVAEHSTRFPFRRLTPGEREIVRQPFPAATKINRLKEHLAGVLARQRLVSLLPLRPRSMGWTLPDNEYWKRIPDAAKSIPRDWSRLPVVRYSNSEIGGVREVRLRKNGEYDQWLLRDPFHDLTAFISVHSLSRKVYFGEIVPELKRGWRSDLTFDACYSCHPSGPRVIRPLNSDDVDQKTLAAFNARILSYGACNFGDTVDQESRGDEIGNSRCSGCHNGSYRGRLYQVHRRTMEFKTDIECTMPLSR